MFDIGKFLLFISRQICTPRKMLFDGLAFSWIKNHAQYQPRCFLSDSPFFSELTLENVLLLPQGSRLMWFVSSIWIMNKLIICNLLHLSLWMSTGNMSTAFSLFIGPWWKSCSITHPFWSLPNKGFSQEEKFLNNIYLKKIKILLFELWV